MRVAGIIEADILKALDIGVHCLHIPNIRNKEDAEESIALVKYPPLGKRGFSPFTRAGNYSIEHAKKLTKAANESVLLAVHVESEDAINNIEAILSIKELDIIFIGLFDISKSLGIPGDVNNPKVMDILQKTVKKISHANKYPGTIVNNPGQLKMFIDYGMRYITYSVDCDVINASYKQIRENFRGLSNKIR
jgi:4-hydroxy-2-oxoheptanedioate aldolase